MRHATQGAPDDAAIAAVRAVTAAGTGLWYSLVRQPGLRVTAARDTSMTVPGGSTDTHDVTCANLTGACAVEHFVPRTVTSAPVANSTFWVG